MRSWQHSNARSRDEMCRQSWSDCRRRRRWFPASTNRFAKRLLKGGLRRTASSPSQSMNSLEARCRRWANARTLAYKATADKATCGQWCVDLHAGNARDGLLLAKHPGQSGGNFVERQLRLYGSRFLSNPWHAVHDGGCFILTNRW